MYTKEKVMTTYVLTAEDFDCMFASQLLAWWIFAQEDSQESTPESLTKWIENFYILGHDKIVKALAEMKISK
jgi:transposase-like protein